MPRSKRRTQNLGALRTVDFFDKARGAVEDAYGSIKLADRYLDQDGCRQAFEHWRSAVTKAGEVDGYSAAIGLRGAGEYASMIEVLNDHVDSLTTRLRRGCVKKGK